MRHKSLNAGYAVSIHAVPVRKRYADASRRRVCVATATVRTSYRPERLSNRQCWYQGVWWGVRPGTWALPSGPGQPWSAAAAARAHESADEGFRRVFARYSMPRQRYRGGLQWILVFVVWPWSVRLEEAGIIDQIFLVWFTGRGVRRRSTGGQDEPEAWTGR